MNICIFGASSNDIDQAYMDAVFNLGKKLAERGHTLEFGAGARGLMGAAPVSDFPPASLPFQHLLQAQRFLLFLQAQISQFLLLPL